MAGKRRGAGRPYQRRSRPERRRSALNVELAAAHDSRARVALAADYLRSALALHPDPATAEEAVNLLIQAADRLYARKEAQT